MNSLGMVSGQLLSLIPSLWALADLGEPQVVPQTRSPALRAPLKPAPNITARYVIAEPAQLRGTTVREYSLTSGPVEHRAGQDLQWLSLKAIKATGQEFQLWLLTDGPPSETLEEARSNTARFILQPAGLPPQEFRNRLTGDALLPSLGGWPYLLPRAIAGDDQGNSASNFPRRSRYLGHNYQQAAEVSSQFVAPSAPKVFNLLPNVRLGVPSNTRQKETARRYDGSEYGYTRLTRQDYLEMAGAGMNCLRVDKDQLPFLDDLDVFYWGLGGQDLPYPECLYDSRYLGPALFLDEPAVSTRDHVLRPRLAKDDAFRHELTPALAFDAFREFFLRACQEGAANSLAQGLAARTDVDLGEMRLFQQNLFSWETMVSTAAYQLSQNRLVPAAMVFEPPGRVGTLRTLPELDMTYGCQIPTDNPNYFIDIIYGFLRGAARLTGKEWGTSIYGAVDRADAPWFLIRAYELGATRFFFWDTAQMACVPYDECLRLARTLTAVVENRPGRDLDQLKRVAEVALVLPTGYNLGHVFLGKGNLWGLSEFNLERANTNGVRFRTVMGNFFTEIERCLRLGIAFDLFGDFPGLNPTGYREIVRLREDGKVEVTELGQRALLEQARTPIRPDGAPPDLAVVLSSREGSAPLKVGAHATVNPTSAPVYYTLGTDSDGVYQNAVVGWELYGPTALDHRFVIAPGLKPRVTRSGNAYNVDIDLLLEHPGQYRLRAATVDMAGRSTVVWTPINVTE